MEIARVGLPLAGGPRLEAWCSVTNMLAVAAVSPSSSLLEAGALQGVGKVEGQQSIPAVPQLTATVLLLDPGSPSDYWELQVPLQGGSACDTNDTHAVHAHEAKS